MGKLCNTVTTATTAFIQSPWQKAGRKIFKGKYEIKQIFLKPCQTRKAKASVWEKLYAMAE